MKEGNVYFYRKNEKKLVRIGSFRKAGWYCWNCHRTLCSLGKENVFRRGDGTRWFHCCPECGKNPDGAFNETFSDSGVTSAYSFTWYINLFEFIDLYPLNGIVDEKGNNIYFANFLEDLKKCPIQFYDVEEIKRDGRNRK